MTNYEKYKDEIERVSQKSEIPNKIHRHYKTGKISPCNILGEPCIYCEFAVVLPWLTPKETCKDRYEKWLQKDCY